jgi:hypothetical protein
LSLGVAWGNQEIRILREAKPDFLAYEVQELRVILRRLVISRPD